MPGRARAWLRGLDPPIYVVGIFPILVGGAATVASASPLPFPSWILLLVAFVSIHAAVNIYNDAFDASSPADRAKRQSLARLSPASTLYAAATILLATGCAIGIALWLRVGGWVVFSLSAAGVALVFLYHAPPWRLSHRGMGEVVTFFGFGPLPVWTTAALADGTLPGVAIAPGIIVGLGAVLVLFYHNLSNSAADAAGGKRTLAAALGPERAAAVGRLLSIAPALWVATWTPDPRIGVANLLVLLVAGHLAQEAVVKNRHARAFVFAYYVLMGAALAFGLLDLRP